MLFLFLPLVILLRIMRPVLHIRLGRLRSDRIGHFAMNTELYLCELDAGLYGSNAVDIFYHSPNICNKQLKKMWDRTLCVFQIASYLDRFNRFFPGGTIHTIPWRDSDRDIYGLLGNTQPHLQFTVEEEERGRDGLRAMGIPDGCPFVCFHQRDNCYLSNIFPQWDWSYHDYRDASLASFIPAAEELARRGYYVIRLGSHVKEALPKCHPHVIDYATRFRTDFLDIYLGAKCHFFFGMDSGIYSIPAIFRRPIAFVHFSCLEYIDASHPHYLFICKKFFHRGEGRFLLFKEVLDRGIGGLLSSRDYEMHDVQLIENTSEEITAIVIEMDERLKGTWQAAHEDEELQRIFWSLFKPGKCNQLFRPRLGTHYLSSNRHLLSR